MKRKTFLLLLVFLQAVSASANSGGYFASKIGMRLYQRLRSCGEIASKIGRNNRLSLIPNIPEKSGIMREIGDINPSLGIEILFLYKHPELNVDENPQRLLTVYNILRSISTLKGVKYYSLSRHKRRILFVETYVIDSPQKRKKRKDPLVTDIPSRSSVFAYHRDSSLGRYVSHIDYRYQNHVISMKMENVSSIKLFIFPVVEPHHLVNYLILFPNGDEILFYGLSCINTVSFLRLGDDKIESLYNRTKALLRWFQDSLEKNLR
ncbi:MAG: DUF6675 family protein [Candidatus Aminicenantales bacterium]